MAPPQKVQIVIDVDAATGTAAIRNFGTTLDQLGVKIKSTEPAAAGAKSAMDSLSQAKQKATAAATALGQEMTRLGGPIGSAAGAVLGLAGKLAGPAGLLAAGAAVAGGLALMSNNLVQSIERLDNLSRQTGLSVATLQAFEQAAEETGEGFERVVPALTKINLEIASVLKGAPGAGEAFRRIGVDLKGLVASGASTEQVLEQVAQRLNAIEDPQRRAAAAAELFGMRGRALTTILKTVAEEGLGGLQEQMRKAGIVTSEETNRMARTVDAEMDKLSREFKGAANVIAAEFLPALLGIVQAAKTVMESAPVKSLAEFLRLLFSRELGGSGLSREALRGGAAPPTPSGATPEMRFADVQESLALWQQAMAARAVSLQEFEAQLRTLRRELDATGLSTKEAIALDYQLAAAIRTVADQAEQLETKRLAFAGDPSVDLNNDLEALAEFRRKVEAERLQLDQKLDAMQFKYIGDPAVDLENDLDALAEFTRRVEQERLELDKRLREQQFEFVGDPDKDLQEDLEAFRDFRRGVEQEAEELANRLAAIFEHALSDVISRAIAGDLDSIDELLEGVADQIRRAISDTIAKDLRELFRGLVGGKARGGLSDAIDAFIKTFKEATAEGEDVFSAFMKAVRAMATSSEQAAQSINAAASAIGVAVGTQIGGGGQGAAIGSAVGTVAGGVIGGYVTGGSPWGIAGGALLGGVAGGYIGGLFDDIEEDFAERLRDATRNAFTAGMLEALASGDVERGFQVFTSLLKNAIIETMIEAFAQQAIFQHLLAPIIDVFKDMVNDVGAVGALAYRDKLQAVLGETLIRIQSMRPLFTEFFFVLQDILGAFGLTVGPATEIQEQTRQTAVNLEEATGHTVTLTETMSGATAQADQLQAFTAQLVGFLSAGVSEAEAVRMALEGVQDPAFLALLASSEEFIRLLQAAGLSAQQIADIIAAIPTETTVFVGVEGPGAEFVDGRGGTVTVPGPGADVRGSDFGRQLGGWVRGGRRGYDSVPQWLEPDEFVVRASQARRHGDLLEAINAGMPVGGGSSVRIGAVNVHVPPGSHAADDPERLAKLIARAVRDETERQKSREYVVGPRRG